MATCSWVEAPVARLYRNFRSSFRDLFASGPSSSEKHLENFSKILSLRCLATCPGNLFATWFNCEKWVFCASRTVFKTFQFFAWKFFTVNYLVHSSLSQTHCVSLTKTSIVLHHLNFNLQENVWVFLFSLNISCLLPWFLGLLSYFLVFPWTFLTVYCLVRSSLSQTHRVSLTKIFHFLHHLFIKHQEKVWDRKSVV